MIDLRIKHLFFDRAKVRRRVDPAKRKALSRGGAFIRQRARTSIRRRKGVSLPGRPPHSHTGLLKKLILFGYDARSDSVVVGPAKLAKRGQVPSLLEFGGVQRVRRTRHARRGRRAFYQPRPYMGPALKKELPQLPTLWRNSIRSG